jgi:hypothetical protein
VPPPRRRRRGAKWPRDGPRPSAVRDGVFEPGHARLIQLLASLAPGPTLRALRGPLARRLAAHPQPSGPSDKAEHATVAEAAAGLLAAAAPYLPGASLAAAGAGAGAAAGSAAAAMEVDFGPAAGEEGGTGAGGEGAWVSQLLREGLSGCSLEMAAAWAAAVRFALGHLMPPAGLAGDAAAANGRAAAASHRAPPPGAAAAALRVALAALLAVPGGGAGAPLLLELKRLRLFDAAVAAVRTYEPDCAPAASASSDGGGAAPALAFAPGYGLQLQGSDADGRGVFLGGFRPPKEARAFLAGVMGEVALLMEAREQPSAVQVRVGGCGGLGFQAVGAWYLWLRGWLASEWLATGAGAGGRPSRQRVAHAPVKAEVLRALTACQQSAQLPYCEVCTNKTWALHDSGTTTTPTTTTATTTTNTTTTNTSTTH